MLILLPLCLLASVYGQIINPNPVRCGVPLVQPITSAVTGDVVPTPGSWPWTSIVTEPNGLIYNSGSFIHPHVVLSSAQHFASAGWSHIPHLQYWRVYSAVSNFNMSHPKGKYSHITNVTIHPGYNAITLEDDVALVFTKEPIEWNDHTRPACLPDSTDRYTVGGTCFLPFWKATSKSGLEITMNQVALPVLSEAACRTFYTGIDPDEELCAGYHDRGKTTCWDDIGSPLMCKDNNGAWYIRGLSSWGGDCYNSTEPLVFKDVSKYSDWIKKTMADAGYTYIH